MSFAIPGIAVTDVPNYVWETHMVLTDENPPIINTLHEVFEITTGCRLRKIVVYQSNTPVDAEEIDVVITLDGTPYTYDSSVIGLMAADTDFLVYMHAESALVSPYVIDISAVAALGYEIPVLGANNAADQGLTQSFIERESIKVEVRQTSPIEAGARIRVLAVYDEKVTI